jgi:hypothetical protein
VVAGTWVEHTGYGHGPTAHGSVRFQLDPEAGDEPRVLRGRWLGFGDDGYSIDSGDWELTFMEASVSGSALLAHRAAA